MSSHKRKRDDVKEHYNKLVKQRDNRGSLMIWNNAVKSKLIQQWCLGKRVIDFCAGKGGDLKKFQMAEVTALTLIDIADKSIEEAQQRFTSMNWSTQPSFLVADCFQPMGRSTDLAPLAPAADVVTCQFALHYAFQSAPEANQLFANAAQNLVTGGHFIATFPNPSRIRNFRNSICSIESKDRWDKADFGQAYDFFLKDCVNHVTEYRVPLTLVMTVAEKAGFRMISRQDFPNLAKAWTHDPLWKRLIGDHTLHPDEQTVFDLYQVIVWQKI